MSRSNIVPFIHTLTAGTLTFRPSHAAYTVTIPSKPLSTRVPRHQELRLGRHDVSLLQVISAQTCASLSFIG